MNAVIDFLQTTTFLGLPLSRLLLAFGFILAGFIVRKFLSDLILKVLGRLSRRTETELDDLLLAAVQKPLQVGVVLAAVGFGLLALGLPTEPADVHQTVFVLHTLALTLVITWLVFRLIDAFANFFASVAQRTESKLDDALIPLFRKALKVFVALLAFVVALQNLGYSITGLLAGLGIGGLALALAAQDTVANLFGSVMILIDRPFKVGDWIKGSDFQGTVEEIGFRSTRVRTFPKTLVSVPNKEMANMIIDNQQAMPMRRITFTVGVTYDTNAAQMRSALDAIREIIASLEGVAPESQLVRFTDFGGSSLDIGVRCFIHAIGYDAHSEVRERLLLLIMEKLEALGLSIAFPSQTLYFGQDEVLRIRGESKEPTG